MAGCCSSGKAIRRRDRDTRIAPTGFRAFRIGNAVDGPRGIFGFSGGVDKHIAGWFLVSQIQASEDPSQAVPFLPDRSKDPPARLSPSRQRVLRHPTAYLARNLSTRQQPAVCLQIP